METVVYYTIMVIIGYVIGEWNAGRRSKMNRKHNQEFHEEMVKDLPTCEHCEGSGIKEDKPSDPGLPIGLS